MNRSRLFGETIASRRISRTTGPDRSLRPRRVPAHPISRQPASFAWHHATRMGSVSGPVWIALYHIGRTLMPAIRSTHVSPAASRATADPSIYPRPAGTGAGYTGGFSRDLLIRLRTRTYVPPPRIPPCCFLIRGASRGRAARIHR